MYKDDDVITVLTKNSVKCLVCNTTLESKHRHHYVQCSCSNETACDGGLEYQRVLAKDLDMVESLSEYEDVTYAEVKAREAERKRLEEERLQQRIDNGEMTMVNGVWISKIVWDKVKHLEKYSCFKDGE